ncbi:MAG: type II toxin-antitoxin system Phd/YefM family antitoxin [Actinobacteria bacterium]|nr:type II toxin-antitoxin system Phd/YefM family antitoxin [Actinomycetota bacterium]
MEKIIGITETRNKIKDLINKVSEEKEVFIITRDSKPEAVVMPYEEYLKNKKDVEEAKKIKFENTLEKIRSNFSEWLCKKGYDINKLSDEEIYEIIRNA